MSEQAERTLGLEVDDVAGFIDNQIVHGLRGEVAQLEIEDRVLWGRVLGGRENYVSMVGVPSMYEPRGDLGELVHAHMNLWEGAGALVPDYQILEQDGVFAVFTAGIEGVPLSEAAPEQLWALGEMIARVIPGDRSVRPSLQTIKRDNFVIGEDTRGREGAFMVDADPYIASKRLPFTSALAGRFIRTATAMLSDAAGPAEDFKDERNAAANGFIRDFGDRAIKMFGESDIEIVRAMSEALLYRDLGLSETELTSSVR